MIFYFLLIPDTMRSPETVRSWRENLFDRQKELDLQSGAGNFTENDWADHAE